MEKNYVKTIPNHLTMPVLEFVYPDLRLVQLNTLFSKNLYAELSHRLLAIGVFIDGVSDVLCGKQKYFHTHTQAQQKPNKITKESAQLLRKSV